MHKMVILFMVIAVLFNLNCARRRYGEFRVIWEGVSHPLQNHLDNDNVNYRFILNKTGKYERQLVATFQFHRKITDLKIQTEMRRKSRDKMASEYLVAHPMHPPESLCFTSRKQFPVFQASLQPRINETDCSMDRGNYTLKPYSIADELRYYAGNKTFYGNFKFTMTVLEKYETNPIFAVEMYYAVLDADSIAWTDHSFKSNAQTTHINRHHRP